MKIKIDWVFLHGGVELTWTGDYKKRSATAVGRCMRGEPKETISVQLGDGGHAVIGGGSLVPNQIGTWRKKHDGSIEIEIFAGS